MGCRRTEHSQVTFDMSSTMMGEYEHLLSECGLGIENSDTNTVSED